MAATGKRRGPGSKPRTAGALIPWPCRAFIALICAVASGQAAAAVPGQPTIGTATAGNAQATVSFTAPSSDGGGAIINYTATSSPGAITGKSTATYPGALLHFDGANGSTTFTDVYGNAWSPVGGAALSTAQFKFGTASLGLNGTNAAIASASGSALIPGASDFTYEAWIYLTGYGTTQASIFDKQSNSGSNAGLVFAVNSSSHVLFALADNGSGWSVNFSGSTALSLNTWYHVAYVRSGSTWTIYLNGNQDGQQTGTSITVADDGSNQLVGAAWNSSTGSFFPGYLDDVRITKGVAVYTANFTPPTAQLSTVAQASPIAVTGLAAGTPYTFTVTATNASGTGLASGASNAVTPIGPPEAPTIGTATGGNAAAIVTFTAPASNGGSPITSYTATSTPGGKTASGSASPITVGGLTNQTAYTFEVTATNSAGTGPPSAPSNSVTPNNGPTVSISTPASGATSSAPATFSLTAAAVPGPSGGAISSVQYYANGTPIAPAITASPYTYSWAGVDAGTYSLTAVVTDNYGTVGISSPVSVTVRESATSVNVYYIYADQVDTPRVITRSSDNQVVWRWDGADPFGAAQPNQNPANLGVFVYDERFPGQLYDAETGTHYNYFRNYDPGLGRYVQSDPIGLRPLIVSLLSQSTRLRGGVNTYAYVEASPVSKIDQKGLLDDSSGGGGGDGGRGFPWPPETPPAKCPLFKEIFIAMIWPTMPMVTEWVCFYNCSLSCPPREKDILIRLQTVLSPPHRFGCDLDWSNPNGGWPWD